MCTNARRYKPYISGLLLTHIPDCCYPLPFCRFSMMYKYLIHKRFYFFICRSFSLSSVNSSLVVPLSIIGTTDLAMHMTHVDEHRLLINSHNIQHQVRPLQVSLSLVKKRFIFYYQR